MTLEELQELVCPPATSEKRAKIHISTSTKPLTDGHEQGTQLQAHGVEFREHAGTIDADGTRWWVLFTYMLFGFAQEMTDNDTTFDAYGNLEVTTLFDAIDFPQAGRDFYAQRLANFTPVEESLRSTASFQSVVPLANQVLIWSCDLLLAESGCLLTSHTRLVPWSPAQATPRGCIAP